MDPNMKERFEKFQKLQHLKKLKRLKRLQQLQQLQQLQRFQSEMKSNCNFNINQINGLKSTNLNSNSLSGQHFASYGVTPIVLGVGFGSCLSSNNHNNNNNRNCLRSNENSLSSVNSNKEKR